MAKRWLITAVLLLALGGCGDEPEAEPATVPVPATSSDAPAPARPPVVAGQTAVRQSATEAEKSAAGFVTIVQRELPGVAVDHRDEEIAALAEQACAALAAGRSADAVMAGVRAFGTDRASARELVRLAVGTVCPAQDRRIGEF
ncbi:DUF732 domain-containing protein [Actinoplanes sp. ATCC 53533]|uniref:DUF732 domain-containing protein n=1 Tax=Actinoplanes sp. ATCC 53533 TaxID=1288362 RepID=UPI001315838A|nr:DUF732 domain-containing protein [Actinoplanes sp. ATCC 53533]